MSFANQLKESDLFELVHAFSKNPKDDTAIFFVENLSTALFVRNIVENCGFKCGRPKEFAVCEAHAHEKAKLRIKTTYPYDRFNTLQYNTEYLDDSSEDEDCTEDSDNYNCNDENCGCKENEETENKNNDDKKYDTDSDEEKDATVVKEGCCPAKVTGTNTICNNVLRNSNTHCWRHKYDG